MSFEAASAWATKPFVGTELDKLLIKPQSCPKDPNCINIPGSLAQSRS
jgi:hypothetical protein